MQEKDCDKIVERIEKARVGLKCSMCGNTMTEEQYTELVEEVHILLAELNLYAIMNQVPVALPDGFLFEE